MRQQAMTNDEMKAHKERRDALIVRLWREKHTIEAITMAAHCSRATVHKAVDDAGLGREAVDNTERNAKIVELWKDGGLSASQIAARMGLTRNVVIGVATRAGITKQKNPRLTRDRQSAAAKRNAARAAKEGRAAAQRIAMCEAAAAQRVAEMAKTEAAPSDAKPLVDLEPNECLWPYGDGPFVFCGKRRIPGAPYCACHLVMSVTPPPVTGVASPTLMAARKVLAETA